MTEVKLPDWVRTDAEVVLFSMGGAGVSESIRLTSIKRVNSRHFTVHGEDSRFRFDRPFLDSSVEGFGTGMIGGTWGHTRYAVSVNSTFGQHKLLVMRYRRANAMVDTAYEQWKRTRTIEDLIELMHRAEVAKLWRERYVADQEARTA